VVVDPFVTGLGEAVRALDTEGSGWITRVSVFVVAEYPVESVTITEILAFAAEVGVQGSVERLLVEHPVGKPE
jgi:hypothetical protein